MAALRLGNGDSYGDHAFDLDSCLATLPTKSNREGHSNLRAV